MNKIKSILLTFFLIFILVSNGFATTGNANYFNPELITLWSGDGCLMNLSATATYQGTELRWQENEVNGIFRWLGNVERLSSGVKSTRVFEFSQAKFINNSTSQYKLAMNATQTIPVPVVGARVARVSLFSASTEEADSRDLFSQSSDFGEGTGHQQNRPKLEFWGSTLDNPDYVGHWVGGGGASGAESGIGIGPVQYNLATTTIKASTQIGWDLIPVFPIAPRGNIFDATGVGLPASHTTAANSLPGSSGILHITRCGLFEIPIAGMRYLRVNTEAIYGTTIGCVINLIE
jgi:hypothetical protein